MHVNLEDCVHSASITLFRFAKRKRTHEWAVTMSVFHAFDVLWLKMKALISWWTNPSRSVNQSSATERVQSGIRYLASWKSEVGIRNADRDSYDAEGARKYAPQNAACSTPKTEEPLTAPDFYEL